MGFFTRVCGILFLLAMMLTVSLVLGVCKALIFFFCFVFDTVLIFCDDFEWIFLLFFLGFCFSKKFFMFGFLFCLLANHLN